MSEPLSQLRVIPAKLLTLARIERVIVHWTAGAYTVSELDRRHYHYILQDEQARGKTADKLVLAIRGNHAPSANDTTADGDYAAHTAGLNSRSFGLSLACMAGAVQGGPYGKYPLTRLLWERGAQAAAEICHAYGLEVSERTVLQHGEVQRVYGKLQSGKWDCCELPWEPELSATAVCDQFRDKVRWYLERVKG